MEDGVKEGQQEKVDSSPSPIESEQVNESPKIAAFEDLPIIEPDLIRTDRERLRNELTTFYTYLLKEWQTWIDDHTEDLRKSHEGRLTVHAKTMSDQAMRPFFKQLRRDQLERNLLHALSTIAVSLQQRAYVTANDVYLRMAIGNAPWPIGVAAVGIHERSAQERIKAPVDKAHVLHDEVTRKWVQQVKRLITHCQRVREPTDPAQRMG